MSERVMTVTALNFKFYFVQIVVPKRMRLKHLVRAKIFFLSKVKVPSRY